MESAEGTIKQPIILGEYEVVEITPIWITIALGRGVHIHIHTHGFPHSTKPGDKLPLYTELTRGPNLPQG